MEVIVVAGTEVVVVGPDGPRAAELVATVADAVTEWVDVTVVEEVGRVAAADAVVLGSTAVGLAVTVTADVDVETAAFAMPTGRALDDRSATVRARTGVWPGSVIARVESTAATAAR